MKSILLTGGRIIDPSQKLDRVGNVLIQNGKIAGFDVSDEDAADAQIVDVAGKIVSPGLIDMHVHLREPGQEEDETIESGTAAALCGGFTSIACAPDTQPPIDSQGAVEFIQHQAQRAGNCNVYVTACVSKNREGKELAEIGQLVQAGAVAFSDDHDPISNPDLMRRALEYCQMFDKPVINHPNAVELSHDGIMHEGLVSLTLGLPGMPVEAEDVMTSRDIALAEASGARVHLMPISSLGSLELIRRAKKRGVNVTSAVCPHHFILTDECLQTFDSNYKINPPLRGQRNVEGCIEALCDGTIDVISSNHEPHAIEKKMREVDLAPFGVVGIETLLGLVITYLIKPNKLDWSMLLEKLTINPAKILGIEKGTLAVGKDADVTVIDPDIAWTVEPSQFKSKSTNTPFANAQLQGKAHLVIIGGEIRWQA